MFRSVARRSTLLIHSARKGSVVSAKRNYAFVNLKEDKTKGVAVLSMNRPPVNSLNLELLTELNIALSKLEDERNCRGVILTSDVPNIFSAGLDITEMYQPEPERLRQFWISLQDFWQTLYGSQLVVFAGINGNSPAGGCLMSMGCDYRIMAEGKYSIGLNETKLGIIAPHWFQDIMQHLIGNRQTEIALQLGQMYTADEALNIKLVDKLVPVDQVVSTAQTDIEEWLKIPELARILTKQQLRAPVLERFAKIRDADLENFVTFISGPAVQKGLGKYMERLKQKAEGKK